MKDFKSFIYDNRWIVAASFLISIALYISFGWYSIWNPDSMCRIMYTGDKAWVSQARWAAQLWEQIFRSQYTIPVLSLMFSVLFLSCIPIVIIYFFNIRKIAIQLLVVVSVKASQHQAIGHQWQDIKL